MNTGGCTNFAVGKMLHAYELGMLGEADRELLEQHLIECGYCFELAQRHSDAIKYLNSDRSIQDEIIAEHSGAEREVSPARVSSKSRPRYIWAVAAVVMVVSAIMFIGPNSDDPQDIGFAHRIVFKDLRSSSTPVVRLDKTPRIVFEFPWLLDGYSGDVSITIVPVTGNQPNKLDFTTEKINMIGKLEIDTARLSKGLHEFRVLWHLKDASIDDAVYTFRIE